MEFVNINECLKQSAKYIAQIKSLNERSFVREKRRYSRDKLRKKVSGERTKVTEGH